MAEPPHRSRFTVGAGAGFAGDRIDPAVRMAKSGVVDTIALECLAERTLINALRARQAAPDSGYDPRLARRLRPLFEAIAGDCRIVTNLGAANPAAAGRAARRLARDVGRGALRIASVIGDDVSDRVAEVDWTQSVEGGEWIGAHAYLGLEPIADALAQRADVVITGRVADSSLLAAAPVQQLGLRDDDAVAGALAAGHLLECAGQLTGGNLQEPGSDDLEAPDLAALGYPLADIERDGSATIRLLDGEPGRLDEIGCTLQLLYEVHDPRAYATPDAVLDFSGLRFDTLGRNRIRMSGARAKGRPERLKVIGFLARRGITADVEIAYAGTGALARARCAADVLRLRLADAIDAPDLVIDLVGVDSVLGAASKPLACDPPEVRVHVSARCDDAETAQMVEDEVYALTLSGPAGGCSIRSERRPRIESITGFIARGRVATRIEWAG
jgi:acyclic terpene utilization AtuA family protein